MAATSIAITGGNNQTGTAGATLATALAVTVLDAIGAPVASVVVAWSVNIGGGTLVNDERERHRVERFNARSLDGNASGNGRRRGIDGRALLVSRDGVADARDGPKLQGPVSRSNDG
jgi:hypothetical protein